MKSLDELSEREQMEFAAKAFGVELLWPSVADLPPTISPTLEYWCPKQNDGDSFRLAAALDIQIEHIGTAAGPTTEVNCWPRGRGDCSACHSYANDKFAATRFAVFEAAVMLGMSTSS